MIRVEFHRFSQRDPRPTWLDGAVRAVPAAPFADVDSGQGGITRADIVDDAMIVTIDRFPSGADVYVESDEPSDALDDETPESEQSTRIWWRATVLGRGSST